MGVEIKKFRFGENKKLFEQFIKLPRKLYKDDPYWVPEWLVERRMFHNPKKNIALKRIDVVYFLAFRDGEPVGRITAHVNHAHNEFHQEKTGFFGFFEATDQEVADALLASAEEEIRARGMDRVRGPANFSSNDEWGMLVDGLIQDPPKVMMTYCPIYYNEFVQNAGYAKAMDVYAFEIRDTNWPNPKIQRIADMVKKRHNVTIRSIRTDKKHFDEEIEKMIVVYNKAWEKNWGFVPLNDEEFRHYANELKIMLDPRLCFVAEVDGEAVGFSLTLPDLHQLLKHTGGKTLPMLWHLFVRKTQFRLVGIVNEIRIAVLGVIREYRRKGLEAAFYEQNFINTIKMGVKRGEISWVLETNYDMINGAKMMGAKHYKTYRIYEKNFEKQSE